jgi:hypothetical protein
MFVCPVCEHQQETEAECEVCGKPLGASRPLNPPIQPLPDLEVTRYSVGAVSAPALAEIERTQLGGGRPLPVVSISMPELERGRVSIGEVPVESLGDLDVGRFQDSSERTPAPVGAVSCRYCRHVQAKGILCEKCGMRLRAYATAPESSASGELRPEDAPVVRHACGAMTRAGTVCSSCGIHVALPSE